MGGLGGGNFMVGEGGSLAVEEGYTEEDVGSTGVGVGPSREEVGTTGEEVGTTWGDGWSTGREEGSIEAAVEGQGHTMFIGILVSIKNKNFL